MEKLIRDINHDARAVTGQKNDVVCFGYQVGSHLNYYQFNPTDYPSIATSTVQPFPDFLILWVRGCTGFQSAPSNRTFFMT